MQGGPEKTAEATPSPGPPRPVWRSGLDAVGRARAAFREAVPPHSIRRSALTALIFIIVTEMLIHSAREHGYFAREAEILGDVILQQQVGVVRRDGAVSGFGLIAADDQTYAAWGDPDAFPKDQLAPLIGFAARNGARAIIVDVDTSRPSPGTDALVRALEQYGRDGPAPPVILVQSILPQEGHPANFQLPANAVQDRLRGNPALHWAAPLFWADPDGVVRRWQLWTAQCSPEVRPVPSVQLLLLALLQEGAAAASLRDALQQPARQWCARPDLPVRAGRLALGGRQVDLEARGPGERMLFPLSWDRRREPRIELAGVDTWLLTEISARDVLSREAASISADPVRGRIVIIGATADAARDWHRTPVGRMPGMLLIANAVATVQQYGQLRPPPLWAEILIGVGFGLLVWALLEFIHFSIALVLCGLAAYGISWVVSHLWLGTGVWMDVVPLSLGILAHRWFVVIEGIYDKRRELGWKALLSTGMQKRLSASTTVSDGGVGAEPANSTHRRVVALVLLTSFGFWAGPVLAQAPEVAGQVIQRQGDATAYRIMRRDGSEVRADLFVDLLAGDRIEALEEGMLTIALPGTAAYHVVRRGQPFVVPRPTAPVRPVSTWLRELLGWVDVQQRRPVGAFARGDNFQVPILQGVRYLVSGTRSLSLSWRGGVPPYRVAVMPVGSEPIRTQEQVSAAQVSLSAIQLSPGRMYEIVVTDARRVQVRSRFQAVPNRLVPTTPQGSLESLPAGVAQVAEAVWLASMNNGEWAYEAAIRLSALDSNFPPAQIAARALFDGYIPTLHHPPAP